MARTLVDSNVLPDVTCEDEHWFTRSSDALERAAEGNVVCIEPVIYAEISIRLGRIEGLEAALPPNLFGRLPAPTKRLPSQASALSSTDAAAGGALPPCRTSSSVPTRPSAEWHNSPATHPAMGRTSPGCP